MQTRGVIISSSQMVTKIGWYDVPRYRTGMRRQEGAGWTLTGSPGCLCSHHPSFSTCCQAGRCQVSPHTEIAELDKQLPLWLLQPWFCPQSWLQPSKARFLFIPGRISAWLLPQMRFFFIFYSILQTLFQCTFDSCFSALASWSGGL